MTKAWLINILLALLLPLLSKHSLAQGDARSRELVVQNIRIKVALVKEGMERWVEEGNDPQVVGLIMRDEFTPLMREGKHLDAVKVADRVLKILSKGPPRPKPKDLSRFRRKTNETQYIIFPIKEVGALHQGRLEVLEQGIKRLQQKLGKARHPTKRNWGFHLMIPAWRYDPDHLENPNANIEKAIGSAFKVAIRNDIAFHITVETHEWNNRNDLWNYYRKDLPDYDQENKQNVEWLDWKGTPHPHRYRDWGHPERMPPVICYNSPRVLEEVRRLAGKVIGPHIAKGLTKLKAERKAHLLSGVTVGAEPSLPNYENIEHINPKIAALMDEDGVPKAKLGYNALTNKGYSRKKPPKDFGQALAEINQDFTTYWARQLAEAGVPVSKMYTHVAAGAGEVGSPHAEFTNAPIHIAFIKHARPGWTTYPIGPLRHDFEILYKALAKHGNPPWASTESGPQMGRHAKLKAREYLERHFEYGATLMLFNTGATSEELSSSLKEGIWNPKAIEAYREFLGSEH